MKATFIYLNSRRDLLTGIASGDEPDSQLYGATHLREYGIEVAYHDPWLTRRPLPGGLSRLAWNLRELTAPFEVGRTDVVVTPLATLLPAAARLRRLPVVALNFGLNLIWRRASEARRALLRHALSSAARIICLGESQRAELIAAAQLDPDRVLTLTLPVDDRYFAPVPRRGDTVLTVGKDLARDYRTFVDAVGRLDSQVHLVAHPRNLESLDLPANVTVKYPLPFAELRAEYARAACVVLPQRSDSFPYGSEGGGLTALLEAMAMGKPIVASERAILRDYVDDGVEALLVPPEDPDALGRAVERVLDDRELARSLGDAARNRVERCHTSRRFAERLAPVLRSVV